MTELRHRVKRDKRASLHEAQCRRCREPFMTRGTGQQCPRCYRDTHRKKPKQARTTKPR